MSSAPVVHALQPRLLQPAHDPYNRLVPHNLVAVDVGRWRHEDHIEDQSSVRVHLLPQQQQQPNKVEIPQRREREGQGQEQGRAVRAR